jgi:hypothetical protein
LVGPFEVAAPVEPVAEFRRRNRRRSDRIGRVISDLRRHLAGLVDGSISIDQFHSWFVECEPAVEQWGNDEDVDLANLVFSRFAEYTSKYIGEPGLIDALRDDADVLSPVVPGFRSR